MYTTAEAAVLRKSANTRTSLSHQTTRRRDSKMSRKVSRREASPACIAGVHRPPRVSSDCCAHATRYRFRARLDEVFANLLDVPSPELERLSMA